jgi:hypothetical protein
MEKFTAAQAREIVGLNRAAEKILENCYKEIEHRARANKYFALVGMHASESTANNVVAQLERDGYKVTKKPRWCVEGETHVLWIKW